MDKTVKTEEAVLLKQLKPLSLDMLFASWIPASLMFAAGETIFLYGAFGGIALSAAILVACLLVIAFLAKTSAASGSRANASFFAGQMSPPLAWQMSLPLAGHSVMSMLLVFTVIESLVMQAMVAGHILAALFSLSQFPAIVMFIGVCLLGRFWVGKASAAVSKASVTLLFLLAIFMPLYVFLQKGLETVYHNLLHYHPAVLHLDQAGIEMFILASICSLIGRIVLNTPNLPGPTENSHALLTKIGWASLCWISLVLAFSTMSIVAITENLKLDHVNRQMLELIKQIASPLMFSGFALVLLTVLFLGFQQSLATVERILRFTPTNGGRLVKLAILICLIACLLLSYLFVHLEWTILKVFLWFGIFLGPIGVSILCSYHQANAALIRWIYPLCGAVAGVSLSLFGELSFAVFIGTGLTAVLHGIKAICKR